MVAVGIQSIGRQQFYSHVFERTGIGTFKDDITGLFLRKEDADKLWRKLRRRKESVKIERMRELCRDLKEGVRKQAADNRKEMSCKAGMMGPDGEEQPQQQQQQKTEAEEHRYLSMLRRSWTREDNQFPMSQKSKNSSPCRGEGRGGNW
jgi:hypothetical protein